MKIQVIGGGPAGLFFAHLMARADAGHDIHVYERDPEGASYGWGLVFSDVALSFVGEVAPEVYDAITRGQVVFDDMEIVHRGQHVTLAGNTFHRMSRLDLLTALYRHCREADVNLAFECRRDDVTGSGDGDLIVAADGANSAIRTRYRERFTPTLDERPHLAADSQSAGGHRAPLDVLPFACGRSHLHRHAGRCRAGDSRRCPRRHHRRGRHHSVDDRPRRIGASMLTGCVPWPEELARRYTEAGLWEGLTVAEMVERTARRQPPAPRGSK